MATNASSVRIPALTGETYQVVEVVFDSVAVSELFDLDTARVIGVFWDENNDSWDEGILAFNSALEADGEILPVNKLNSDETAFVNYETPTLLGGYTPLDIDTLAGCRFIQLVSGAQPGTSTTGRLYLVVRDLT